MTGVKQNSKRCANYATDLLPNLDVCHKRLYHCWTGQIRSERCKERLHSPKMLRQNVCKNWKLSCPWSCLTRGASRPDNKRTGRGGVKVLAQHHCDPPPGRGETKVWGKVVRKRFKGIVKGMRKEMEERVFERERSEGYERSRGEDERRVREEEEEVRGGEERRLERSDSKSITSPSCITNNLPLVDSLLASSPIPTHSVLRFARRRLRGLGQRRRRGLGGRLRSRKGGLGWLRNFRMNRRWGARALSLLVSCTRGGGRRGLGIKIRTAWRMLSTGAMLCSRLMEGSGRL